MIGWDDGEEEKKEGRIKVRTGNEDRRRELGQKRERKEEDGRVKQKLGWRW